MHIPINQRNLLHALLTHAVQWSIPWFLFFYSEIKPSKKTKYWCMVDTDEWRCIFLIFLSLKKKKSSKKVNQSSIYKSYFYEIKNLYKYMFKTYTLTIIHKKKFISNGMISFNLHTVSIAHPSAKSQAP